MSDLVKQRKIEPKRLKGFKDHLPTVMESRSLMQSVIRQQAKLAGFREIGTPALEYLETLLGQGSDETDKQVYKFEDHGGRQVGLRFDLTIPFARFIAEHHGELSFPFKRLQIGEVWRGENTQKGRYREFCQCDLDIIGVDSVGADFEVLACLFNAIAKFNVGGFTMRLGNRNLLSSLLRRLFLNLTPAIETQALIALDKLDKIGITGVTDLLLKIPEVAVDKVDSFLTILTSKDSKGGTNCTLIRSLIGDDAKANAELLRMEQLLTFMEQSIAIESLTNSGAVRLDLSIARGLGYYTGVVFETTLDLLPGFGSICSGGRYDNLAERFSNRSLPGVGGSIGLDRLVAGLEELNKLPRSADKMVFVAVATQDAASSASALVSNLRRAGVACDVGLTTGKVGNQFKHADRLGCPYVLTIGTDEAANHTYNLKDMASGEEHRGLPVADVVSHLKKLLN